MLSPRKRTTSGGTQATISSFFSQTTSSTPSTPTARGKTKRRSTPIDLTIDSDDGEPHPPHKRQKTSSSFFGVNMASPKPATQATGNGGHAEQWRFDPSSPSKATEVGDSEEQRRAREKAKRILLGGDDVLNGRNRSNEPPATVVEEDDSDEEHTEKKFGELLEMFSSKPSKKSKSTAKRTKPPVAGPSRSRSQKAEEIGPSGQPYTPFELQVCSFYCTIGVQPSEKL